MKKQEPLREEDINSSIMSIKEETEALLERKEQFATKVDKLYKDIGEMCGDFRIKYA